MQMGVLATDFRPVFRANFRAVFHHNFRSTKHKLKKMRFAPSLHRSNKQFEFSAKLSAESSVKFSADVFRILLLRSAVRFRMATANKPLIAVYGTPILSVRSRNFSGTIQSQFGGKSAKFGANSSINSKFCVNIHASHFEFQIIGFFRVSVDSFVNPKFEIRFHNSEILREYSWLTFRISNY